MFIIPNVAHLPVVTIAVGAKARIYYDEDTYDEGEVTIATEHAITIDFYDWIERWRSISEFVLVDLYYEAKQVLMPLRKGEMVTDFRVRLTCG